MLVIHGIWDQDAFHLWAEDSGEAEQARSPIGRSPIGSPIKGTGAPQPHPFASQPALLVGALDATGQLTEIIGTAAPGDITLWLPSTRTGPTASPELARTLAGPGQPGRPGRAELSAWRVPVLTVAPVAALDLLNALGGQGNPPGGSLSTPGGSLRYFCAVGALAADLASLGRVLPSLIAAGGGSDARWEARWRPVLTGPHAQRARELAQAMPPVCRSAVADGVPPALVLTCALDALTDAAVRARISSGGGEPVTLLPRRRGRRPPRVSVAERWIAALSRTDPARVLVALDDQDPEDSAEVKVLATALDDWRATAQAPAGPVRTCFRLTEPAEYDKPEEPREAGASDESWRVEFLLQSTGDPSLVVAAAAIWAGSAAGWPGVAAAHPEEELLAGLGRAARLFPELDAELRTRAPSDSSLDRAGAFRFLKETAPLLQAAGFGVLLPAWARKSRLGLKLTTRSARSSTGTAVAGAGFGLDELVDFRYDLAIGDDVLDPDELAEIARLKMPLVRLRGQWMELDQRQLQAALRFLERRRSGTVRAGDALLAAVGADDPERLPLTDVDADGWLGDLISGQAEQRLDPAGPPSSFAGTLRPYQERGLAWLRFLGGLGLGAILADDMGLGKTVQLLALLSSEREALLARGDTALIGDTPDPDGPEPPAAPQAHAPAIKDHSRVKPTLLVCPMSLVGNWQREAARFTPGLRVHVHHGAGRLTGGELAAALAAADLVITTYALVARDGPVLAGIDWARVVCDEAQNIKNSATRQARAVRAIPAAARIALTGTPVENHLAELWSIMEFTNAGLLGSAESFRSHYAVPIERHGDEEATAALRRLTGPFILRRLKTDRSIIADLPDKLEMKVWCNLTPEQATLYQATVEEMLAKIEAAEEGIERRGLVLATMAKLKQVCNHPAHLLGDGSALAGRSGKLARLEETCDEVLADGERALCFTQYAQFGAMLEPYLAARLGCRVLYLHGGTSKRERDALVAQFQESGEPGVFLLSLRAGSTGLNLTAANHVIHLDRWWNPAVEDQATDRAFRIGHRKDVQVRKFICVGTLEERIDAMIEQKKALADRIVGTGEAWLTEMSVAQLREVIALSPEAVSE